MIVQCKRFSIFSVLNFNFKKINKVTISLSLLNSVGRRIHSDLLDFYKILHSKMSLIVSSILITRSVLNRVSFVRTEVFRSFFTVSHRASCLWNSISSNVPVPMNIDSFRKVDLALTIRYFSRVCFEGFSSSARQSPPPIIR